MPFRIAGGADAKITRAMDIFDQLTGILIIPRDLAVGRNISPQRQHIFDTRLLHTLVLDIKKYRTIPMAIQYFRGGYGRVELAPMMACIIIAIIPIIILYMTCQKYIIEGVVAGAVKG